MPTHIAIMCGIAHKAESLKPGLDWQKLAVIRPNMSASPQLIGITVLLVDDDADARAILEYVLVSHGASVIPADSGREALQIIAGRRPDFLISDIVMPEMDGRELLARVRASESLKGSRDENLPPLPAAAVTSYTFEKSYVESELADFQFYFTKPVDFAGLIFSIASATGDVKRLS